MIKISDLNPQEIQLPEFLNCDLFFSVWFIAEIVPFLQMVAFKPGPIQMMTYLDNVQGLHQENHRG